MMMMIVIVMMMMHFYTDAGSGKLHREKNLGDKVLRRLPFSVLSYTSKRRQNQSTAGDEKKANRARL
jgi:hypothetical protein